MKRDRDGRRAAIVSATLVGVAGLVCLPGPAADWGAAAFAATVVTGPLALADGRTVDNPLRVTFLLEREGSDGPLRIRHTHLSNFI